VPKLTEKVRGHLRGRAQRLTIDLDMRQGKALNLLENRSQVLDRQYNGQTVRMTVQIGQRVLDQLRAMGAQMQVQPADGENHGNAPSDRS
jgi:hypothetical protein